MSVMMSSNFRHKKAPRRGTNREKDGKLQEGKEVGGMAGTTGLEPATSAVTGQRSNQLSYVPASLKQLSRRAYATRPLLVTTLID